MENKEKFIGMNYLTGAKIYLTSEEDLILKKRGRLFMKWFFGICGIILIFQILFIILICL